MTEGKSVCSVITRGQIQYLLALVTPKQMWPLEKGHTLIKQGNAAVILKQSHRHQGPDSIPVVRRPAVFKDHFW